MLKFSNLDERVRYWREKDAAENEYKLRADIIIDLHTDLDDVLKTARVKRELRDKIKGLVNDLLTVRTMNL